MATLVAAPAAALAQDAPPDPKGDNGADKQAPATDLKKAAEHYQKAEAAVAEKRWSDAAREYGIAYEHSRDPVLFYKLATAFQNAGDCTSALIYFKRYLSEAKPSDDFKTLTQQQIAACEAAVKAAPAGDGTGEPGGDGAKEPAGDGAQPPADDSTLSPFADDESPTLPVDATPDTDPSLGTEPSWQRTAAWISVGIAVALGTTGGVLGLAAGSREDDINAQIDFRDPTQNVPTRFEGNAAKRYNDLVDQGERFEVLSLISLAAAGAAVGAAVVFFILDPGPDAASGTASLPGARPLRPAVAPAIGPDTIGVSAAWRFE